MFKSTNQPKTLRYQRRDICHSNWKNLYKDGCASLIFFKPINLLTWIWLLLVMTVYSTFFLLSKQNSSKTNKTLKERENSGFYLERYYLHFVSVWLFFRMDWIEVNFSCSKHRDWHWFFNKGFGEYSIVTKESRGANYGGEGTYLCMSRSLFPLFVYRTGCIRYTFKRSM